jgi:3-oxoacyl-[acyl-carrier protein] reductase
MFSIGGSVNAAMNCLTKSLADTGVRDKVRVNAILPGYVRTERLRKRLDVAARETGIEASQVERRFVEDAKIFQIGEPEDIAGLVAFIVGPEGRFFHGALIDMDGGATKAL